jgi:RNA-directed DNA polymerase
MQAQELKKEIYHHAARFGNIRTPENLMRLLKISPDRFVHLLEKPEYKTFFVPKKSGGQRQIDAPCEELWVAQRNLKTFLNTLYIRFQPDAVMGFIPHYKGVNMKTGIVENAKRHIGQPFVLNMDVANFFPSIKIAAIKKMFMHSFFNFPEELAHVLALLTCYEGKLPQGAPSSPMLSNFLLYDADLKLSNLASKNNLTYTRYADDLTISGFIFPQDKFQDKVQEILLPYGLKLNEKKIRYQSFVGRQEVTGIKVNVKLNVDRKYIRRIRAILHCWDMKGIKQTAHEFHDRKIHNADEFMNTVRGMIAHVGNVRGDDDDIYLKFREKFGMLMSFEDL